MKNFSFVYYGLLLTSLSGCSTAPSIDYSKAGLVDVDGTITLDGQPLAGAVVTFEMPDGQFSFAETDADGYYELQFDTRGKMGVTPGPKIVRISTAKKILGLNAEEGEGEAPEGEASTESGPRTPTLELVPEKYNKNSELKVEVKPDESQTFDFDLTSK